MQADSAPRVRLLVVDDDVPTRMVLKGVLGKQGYEVWEAENGLQALEKVMSLRPDLVLMDVMMPVMDGFSACAEIRLADGDESLPIIMLTGADDMSSIETAFNAGATDFITKPISWPLLTERVRYALRTGALNREVRRSRVREASVRKIAGLGYWEWQLAQDNFVWTEELELLTGVSSSRLNTIDGLVASVHEEDRKRLKTAVERARDIGARVDLEFRLLSGDNQHMIRMVGERGTEGDDTGLVFGVYQDVTENRRTEALVDFLALHDETTGLGNRRLFIRAVRDQLGKFHAQPTGVLLIGAIDLARFGRFNDTLGEQGADKLLAMVAQRLSKHAEVIEGEVVARVGGDEFALMIPAADETRALNRFSSALDSLSLPFRVEDEELFVSLSAGVTLFPEHEGDAEQLLTQAQDMQRTARQQGRQWLKASSDPEVVRRQLQALQLEQDLYKALENREFFLVYQPQMAFESGRIVGAEALIRWRHPSLGVVPPVQFVGLLEDTGLINDVGNWVLEEACRQAAVWERAGLNLRIGINLSPRQFMVSNLYETVTQACLASGVSSSLIELEITESLAMQDVSHSVELLERLRRDGFKIAIDDFGIGHSSLEYLLRFPIDVIKIDRAFVTKIADKPSDRAIAQAVTVLGHALGLQVIAEGVEEQAQSDILEHMGVGEIQGYLIGKPMPADAFEAMARDYVRDGAGLPLNLQAAVD